MIERIRRSLTAGDLMVWALVALVVIVPLAGLFGYAGPPMEEGFMLVFPELLNKGYLPHIDFLHLYGPGSLWFLAGAYRIFGTTLEVERMVALFWDVAIIAAATTVGRRWGRSVAVVSGVLAAVLTLTPTGLTALAWNGAIALGFWGAIGAARASSSIDATDRRAFVSGVFVGVALLFRPDLLVAVGAVLMTSWWLSGGDVGRPLIRGAGLGVSPMLLHVALVGPAAALEGMFIDPVFRLRDGRSLPRPPSWDVLDGALQKAGAIEAYVPVEPLLSPSRQMVVWFVVMPLAAIGVVAAGVWSRRRSGPSDQATMLVVVGAFAVGLLPQALQRPDSTHLAWVGCVVFPLVPAALAEVASIRESRITRYAAVGLVPFLFVAVLPSFSAYPYVDVAAQGLGLRTVAHVVERDGRRFYLGTEAGAAAAQSLVDDLGSRDLRDASLFVGTADLRFTPYSDAFFYHLFPETRPATRYIEMDPGIANAADSGLAEELRTADYLILSHFWDVWVEPNESTTPGSDEPNDVVASQFCLVAEYDGMLELYERCRS